jgi:hypothetical protein
MEVGLPVSCVLRPTFPITAVIRNYPRWHRTHILASGQARAHGRISKPGNHIRLGIGHTFLSSEQSVYCSSLAQFQQFTDRGCTHQISPAYLSTSGRAARITGDVDLLLTVRQDGAVDSVVVKSGHPLLARSALTSAQQAKFECRGCTERFSDYRLIYSFEVEGECECYPKEAQSKQRDPEQTYLRITDAQHRVTVVAHIVCMCDPSATINVRSLKCLYLWRCGSKF